MIRNARAFRLDEAPRRVVGRNPEQQRLARCLEPLVDGAPGEAAILAGPAGAGKTTVAQSTAQRLRERSIDVQTCYLHCSGGTRFSVYQQLGRATGVGPAGHARSSAELLDKLRALSDCWCVILDEIDAVADRGLITDLWEIPELTIVAVTNNVERLQGGLNAREQSRVRAMRTIQFDPYTDAELVRILRDRADWGLVDGVVSDRRLDHIARTADGDARTAISILHSAAQIASEAGATEITAEHVTEEAIGRAAEGVMETQLDKLSPYHELVYRIVDEGEDLTLGELYEQFLERSDEARSKRMVQNYLSDLCKYDLVERRGPKRTRTFATRPPVE